MIFEVIVGTMAVASLIMIIRNTRATGTLQVSIRRAVQGGGGEDTAVIYEGVEYEPVIYVSEDPVRDESGRLGERLVNLARSVRVNVTYSTTLFRAEKGRLLSYIEDQIVKAQFAYQATRHVRYSERLRFLKELYNEVARTHTPYSYRLGVIVWIPRGSPEAKAKAEAFKSMVEVEAGVKLERVKARNIIEAIIPEAGILGKATPSAVFAGTGEMPGIVIGRDSDGRLIVLDWPRDFETHIGVYGPTGRGKTVLLAGIAGQLASRSETRLDPYMVVVIDPKGDLARLLERMATRVYKPLPGYCVPVPRTEGMAESLLSKVLGGYPTKSVGVCEGSILRRGLVVYDLTHLPNEDRDIAASLLLTSLVIEASEHGLPGRVVAVIDEAWRISSGEAIHFVWALREGRSKGLHIVYATQSPDDVPDAILTNTGTLIVFGGYTRSYTEAARRLGLDDARRLLELPVGSAMVKIKDLPPVEARLIGFHEYVKRGPRASREELDRGVITLGETPKTAESG